MYPSLYTKNTLPHWCLPQQPAAVYSAVDRANGCQMNTDYTSSVHGSGVLTSVLCKKKLVHCYIF